MASVPTCILTGDTTGTEDILTPEALTLVATLQRVHDHSRRSLLERRTARAASFRDGARPGLLERTAAVRDGDWKVRPAPADLADRRCEITGPSERKMMISALNSGARVFMTDIEDSLSPRWTNVVDAQRNETRVTLSNVEIGGSFDASLFRFQFPDMFAPPSIQGN